MTSRLSPRLEDPLYRNAFVGSQINIGIPFQLRALLKASGWTQQQLAERAEMLQPRISGMLKPGKTKFTIETLRRLAAAFDVALMVRFVPFSDLQKWSDEFDPDSFQVPTFGQEQEAAIYAGNGNDVDPESNTTSDPQMIEIEAEIPSAVTDPSPFRETTVAHLIAMSPSADVTATTYIGNDNA